MHDRERGNVLLLRRKVSFVLEILEQAGRAEQVVIGLAVANEVKFFRREGPVFDKFFVGPVSFHKTALLSFMVSTRPCDAWSHVPCIQQRRGSKHFSRLGANGSEMSPSPARSSRKIPCNAGEGDISDPFATHLHTPQH